jgi:hypothetical protein
VFSLVRMLKYNKDLVVFLSVKAQSVNMFIFIHCHRKSRFLCSAEQPALPYVCVSLYQAEDSKISFVLQLKK